MQNYDDMNNPFDDMTAEEKERAGRQVLVEKFLKSFIFSFVLVLVIFFISSRTGVQSWGYYLSNALFVVGVVMACMGILSVVKKEGFFDIVQFGFKQVKETIKYSVTMNKDKRIDTDFIGFKEEKRAVRVANWSSFFIGLIYIAGSFFILLFL